MSLSPVKRQLFARLMQQRGLRAGSRESITPREQSGPCRLSFAQQRLWFMDQMESGSPAYNIPLAVRLDGVLDVAALERSLNEVERRHEVLRTVFALDNEQQAVQVVQPWQQRRLNVRSVTVQAARDAVDEEARRPFNLQQGPLWRAELLQIEPSVHILLLTMHHIISDGWSMGIFIREVAQLYEAFANNAASPLPELSIQYADFAHWQRNWFQGDVLNEQMKFWREQLSGELPTLELPTDYRRPQQQTYRGARQSFHLNAALTERLKQLSREHDTTLFMTLLAGFQTLLHRYSGQEDIIVGTPIANRNRAEIEDLIGFFVNTLVLRTRLLPTHTFSELLAQVREVTLGAYAHQDVPFEKLVEELQPDRDNSRHPLFQVVFVVQNAPIALPQIQGLSVTNLNVEPQTAKFDIVVNLHETENGLSGVLAYNIDLFEDDTISRLLKHYESLLEEIVDQPFAPLKSFDLLTEEEKLILETRIEVEELSESFCF
ncbi:MAG TPA: condensation domain-containing protein [Pyrinomonadaceae bacterium]|nr:condensation domain-containing protein [Pyrinomonadaceae bacterium]